MKVKVYIFLTVILLATSVSTAQEVAESVAHPICKLGFSEAQLRRQQTEMKSHIEKVKQVFTTNSQLLLYKIFRNSYNYKQELETFTKSVTPQVQKFSDLFRYFLFTFGAVYVYWFLRIVFGFDSIKIGFLESKTTKKIALFVFMACVTMAAIFAIAGYFEGGKAGKSMASLVCKLYEPPKGVVRGGKGPKYNGLNAYISQVEKYQSKFAQHFQKIQQLFSRQYVIQEMIEAGKNMLTKIQPESQEKADQLNNFLQEMNRTVANLEELDSIFPKIKKSLKWFNKTLEYSRELVQMAQVALTSIENYTNQHLPFAAIVRMTDWLVSLFYLFIIFLSIFVIVNTVALVLKKPLKIKASQSLVQYLLTIPIIICLTTAYLNSFVIPGFSWSNEVIDYMYSSEVNLRDEFTLPQKVRADLVELLTHIIPVRGGDFTQMYYGHLMNNITEYGKIIQFYDEKQVNFFDNLYQKGISLSKKPITFNLSKIEYLEKKHLMGQVLVNLQQSKEDVRQILSTTNKQTGQLAVINPYALGIFLKQLHGILRTAVFNRFYNARWICGVVGALLLISLISSIFLKDIVWDYRPKYQNLSEQEDKNELFTNDNAN